MKNFELRYLERKTGKNLMNEYGYYYDETENILQYRYKETVTDYKLSLEDGSYLTTNVWSEWYDVPVVNQGE